LLGGDGGIELVDVGLGLGDGGEEVDKLGLLMLENSFLLCS